MEKRTTPLLILDLGILNVRFLPHGANALTTLSGTPLYRVTVNYQAFSPPVQGGVRGGSLLILNFKL